MNWKRLWMTIKKECIHYQRMFVILIGFIIIDIVFTLANNYYQFVEINMANIFRGFGLGICAVFALQASSVFINKRTAIPYMMVPASDLEKFVSRIIVYTILPFCMYASINYIVDPVPGTFFAQQLGVEKCEENMERFRPEEIECTNFMNNMTYTYRNDSVVATYHGRFQDVEVYKYHNDWIQVGINSSALGDIMLLIGILGIVFFTMLSFKKYIVGSYLGCIFPVLVIIGFNYSIEKVFYNSMSVATTENYIFIVSFVESIYH